MAILHSVPNIEVYICVNGIPLEEHPDDEVDGLPSAIGEYRATRTVSSYVESQTDQEFSIRLILNPPYTFECPNVNFKVVIDGGRVSGAIFRTEAHGRRHVKDLMGRKKGERGETEAILLPYKFSKIETSSDESLLSTVNADAQRISQVGEICVEAFRTGESVRVHRTFGKAEPGCNESEVHEKALKGQAKSHGMTYGEGRSMTVHPWLRSAPPLDSNDKPLARFVFKYQSRESLKALLIIPRLPSPDESLVPLPRNPANTGGSLGSNPKVKRERDENQVSGGPLKKLKQRPEEIEVVDLTED